MEKERFRQELGKQLRAFGFKEIASPCQGTDAYSLWSKPILGRKNYVTEVDVGFYGWETQYYTDAFNHYTMSECWKEGDTLTVESLFSRFFEYFNL